MRLSMGIFDEMRRSRIDETTISDDLIRLKRLVVWRQRRNLPTHLPWETSIIFVSIYVSFAFFVISVLNLAWKFKILSEWIWCIVWHQIVKIWRHNCQRHPYVNLKNIQQIRKLKRYFASVQTVWWTFRGFAVLFTSIAFLCSLLRRRHRSCDAQLPSIARFHPKRFLICKQFR